MTDKEVLQKAIEIAIKNGWSRNDFRVELYLKFIETYKTFGQYAGIIFSHDFAKAFFPDGDKIVPARTTVPLEVIICEGEDTELYKFHLMIMVRYENPIDYLRKYIK